MTETPNHAMERTPKAFGVAHLFSLGANIYAHPL